MNLKEAIAQYLAYENSIYENKEQLDNNAKTTPYPEQANDIYEIILKYLKRAHIYV